MKFLDKLKAVWTHHNSMLMVGLDPDPTRMPAELLQRSDGIFQFCKGIIDATADYICGIKPQIAYFASESAEEQLQALCDYVRQTYPHLPIVLDAKRGDIGSTAEHYALEAFDRYRADAVTVNPYMGLDSVEPYLEWKNKGLIVLCRTSNPGGSDLQFLKLENGLPLYLHVASMVADKWNEHEQCGLVVGATYPDEIAQVRARVGDMPLLIPGIGAQGGDINATVLAGADSQGLGMMINSSRAILYASREDNWREAAQATAIATRNAINDSKAAR